MTTVINTHLDQLEEYINDGNRDDAAMSLGIINLCMKRNTDPSVALRYSKLKRKYEELSRRTLLEEKIPTRQKNINVNSDNSQDVSDVVNIEQRNLQRLLDAKQQLNEAENVAADTLVELKKQGETMKTIKGNLRATDDELKVSNTFLNRMMKWWRR